ncbi:hypoxanthine phosphoribosyltransferase [Candidatus Saccharibacteria bacterium]|nr:hypoxanthine phosphoribosyltransferase [Candidatus Saccharibacteria bacterium]
MYCTFKGRKSVCPILLSKEQALEGIRRLARQIAADYARAAIHLVIALKGAKTTAGYLAKELDELGMTFQVDGVRVKSYAGTESTGKLNWLQELAEPDLAGKHVLVVEDIIDSGYTLSELLKVLKFRYGKPASIRTVALLDKPSRRRPELKGFKADYTGFEIQDVFVVGFGLDWDEEGRELPNIVYINPEDFINPSTN